jgi:hypothetical protein
LLLLSWIPGFLGGFVYEDAAMRIWPVASVLLLAASHASAAELPEPVLPQGVGVNIHFTRGHGKDLDLIAAGGFKIVRMDFSWSSIEHAKGQYRWSEYDELTVDLEKRGLRPMYILDYSNPLYEETVISKDPLTGRENRSVAAPQHPESIAAFARWAGAAAKHFRGRHVLWEIWNEPNIGFWRPRPDVGQYTTLALATARAVRAADPDATLVAPATSEVPLPFLEHFFAAGALHHLDAVSVHPYRPYRRPPETAVEDYTRLRRLIEQHAPAGKNNLPVLSGEWGYAAHTGGVTREVQAAYLVRMQLANLLDGVPVSIWYDWKDDGSDPKEREHNFGVMTHDLKPKPAYQAVQVLTRTLSGYRIQRRLEVGSTKDYVLLLTDSAGHLRLAAWTLDTPHAITIKGIEQGKLLGIDSSGLQFKPGQNREGIVLELGVAPMYLVVGNGLDRERGR